MITWREKWADCWDEVKYCSAACRGRKLGDVDRALEVAILSLLSQRDFGKTICPSEAARAVDEDRWRELMEPARMAARRLVNAGKIVITQGGQPVDPSRAKGPIRLRLLRP